MLIFCCNHCVVCPADCFASIQSKESRYKVKKVKEIFTNQFWSQCFTTDVYRIDISSWFYCVNEDLLPLTFACTRRFPVRSITNQGDMRVEMRKWCMVSGKGEVKSWWGWRLTDNLLRTFNHTWKNCCRMLESTQGAEGSMAQTLHPRIPWFPNAFGVPMMQGDKSCK